MVSAHWLAQGWWEGPPGIPLGVTKRYNREAPPKPWHTEVVRIPFPFGGASAKSFRGMARVGTAAAAGALAWWRDDALRYPPLC